MNIRAHVGILALAVALTGNAWAQTPSTAAATPTNLFATLDKNKDGKLSNQEVKGNPELYTQFDALDKNQDGFLTAPEFAVWTPPGKAPVDPSTAPGGSAGAQHMPAPN
jgi:hypothetical protein